jgi:hypothetical protein
MRFNALVAALAALACVVVSMPEPASADGMGDGITKERKVRRWYRPRYAFREDPYAYQYEPRGYYPYYGSAYWRPTAYVRMRDRLHYNVWNTQPPYYRYYSSWGYPKPWHNRAWHAAHHGRHWPWHW